MATTVTKTIGATGRDYATINDFFAAVPADLVAIDELWEGIVYPDSGNTITAPAGGFSLGAKTTDATRYVRLKCAPGASFKDHADKLTNPLRANADVGVLLTTGAANPLMTVAATNIEIVGMQLRHTLGGITYYGILHSGRVVLRDSIIQTVDRCINGGAAGSEPHLYNSLLISSNSGGCRTAASSSTVNGIAKGCTFVANASAGYPIRIEYRPLLLKDCAYFGMSAAPYGSTITAGSSNNATDQTSFPTGVTGAHSLTQANQFEVIDFAGGTNDFRVKAGSGLIGAGVADADISTDIIGTTRADPPTVGAWDYAASGAGATFTITTADATFSGSGQVSPIASFALTASAATVSGAASSGTSAAEFAISTEASTFSGAATGDTSNGVLTTPALKNNTGTLLVNETGIAAYIYTPSTGALVVAKTGQTTNASGVMTITDSLIVAGTQYRVVIVLGSGAEGMDKLTAT